MINIIKLLIQLIKNLKLKGIFRLNSKIETKNEKFINIEYKMISNDKSAEER